MTIPTPLTIQGQKLLGLTTTFNGPFPGLPRWRLEVLVKDPIVVHLWRHEDCGLNPVAVDIYNNHDTAWLKGKAGNVEFTLPSHTGRSFVDDEAMVKACDGEEMGNPLKMQAAQPLPKTGKADKLFTLGMTQPDVDITFYTGSSNMRFWQPESWWVEQFGKTKAAILWFDAYRKKSVLRPRHKLAPNGFPSNQPWPKFNEWDIVQGLNAWDSQHLDGQELCDGARLFLSAPHLLAAVSLWQRVKADSVQLKILPEGQRQYYSGSSRVPGWYFTFAAQLLRALDVCESDPYIDQLRTSILKDVDWHLQNCLAIHPMENPWFYGSFKVPNEQKTNYWVPYQFGVKWWGCLNLFAWATTHQDNQLIGGNAAGLADKIHDHIMTCWLPDKQSFADYMTVDYKWSEETSVPGVGSWFGPPSMLAKQLGLKSADEFRTVVDKNIAYFKLDPLKADAVNLLMPEMKA